MGKNYKTEQEEFWSGDFGDEYIGRNIGDKLLASNLFFFSNILRRMDSVKSIIEFGSNVGMNLKAFRLLLPEAELSGIENNQKAYDELLSIPGLKGYHTSILDFSTD